MDDPSTVAQRRYFRAAVDFPVAVTASEETSALQGHAVDLSSGGMRVCTKNELAPGANVTLRFTLPEATNEILVHGLIVLSFFDGSRDQFAHGIAFTQIAPTDQTAIENQIHELQQRARLGSLSTDS